MHWKFIARLAGILLVLLSLSMFAPLGVSLLYHEGAFPVYIKSILVTLTSGMLLVMTTRKQDIDAFISQKVGMAAVALSWLVLCLFGALPFIFSPDFGSLTDAVFESVSGFTTTGSSVMTDIEAASKSLLFWRCLIQWLGGMGIIVLSLAVLPFLGVGGTQLYKAEVPSPSPDKLTPRLSDSAKILWMVYLTFTAAEIILLYFGGMPLYESICHAFTTLPTGGFSPKNTSIAFYDSAYFDWVITAFMAVAGINFSLHFQLLRGRPLAFWRDTEFKCFIFAILIMTLWVTWDIYGPLYETIGDALRFAAFQVVSIITTTGFASADYELFSGLSQVLLLLCMFTGACAGSTGGGIKFSRIIVSFKFCYRELFKILHPRSVKQIQVDGTVLSNDLIRNIMGFIGLYLMVYIISCLILGALGLDLMTALGSAAACLGNIGPGFGTVGPTENFAHLPAAAKWILSLCMLLGRLEIYTVIILFVPEFWKS